MNKTIIFFMLAILWSIGCTQFAPTTHHTETYPHFGVGPGGVVYSYSDENFLRDTFKEDWDIVRPFVAVYKPENALSFSNNKLEEYYDDHRENMSGWKKVTKPFANLKSKLSDCEIRLERIKPRIYEIEDQADKRAKMLRAVEQARINIAKIQDSMPAFEAKMNAVLQEKETE